MIRGATTIIVALALGGCVSAPPLGDPIEHVSPSEGYRFRTRSDERHADDLLLVLTFSGGGTRAAALAFGVMQQLEADQVPWAGRPTPVLDRIDLISAVSGGSILAAYYGVRGDRLFDEFPRRLLKRDLESRRIGLLLAPRNWVRLASPRFARGDLYAEYLDRKLFRRATFADLDRRGGPFIVINAADLSVGARFPFTQDRFDALCLDLSTYSVGRAVAASSAMPIAVTPIALQNHAGSCGYRPPAWHDKALADRASPRLQRAAEQLSAYQRPDVIRYLQLADGALTDSLGVRAAIDVLTTSGDTATLRDQLRLGAPRRVAFIVVDAKNSEGLDMAGRPDAPDDLDVARRGALLSVDLYSFESELTLRAMLDEWAARVEPSPADVYYVKVELAAVADPAVRDELLAIPTSLHVPDETVDRLICAGAGVLRNSDAYRRLLKDLGGGAPLATTCPDRP